MQSREEDEAEEEDEDCTDWDKDLKRCCPVTCGVLFCSGKVKNGKYRKLVKREKVKN